MRNMIRISAVVTLLSIIVGSWGIARVAHAADGQMTWAVHVTIAPRWLDPGDTETAITPFMVLYALHDALVKPMPKGQTTPSLAESWTVSPDWKTYEFVLRNGIKFHNGDPVTADDVKFSFERYRGGAAKLLKERVKDVQVVDARHVRFVMKESWPDFMTFYGTTASGAGWIVPKKYVEKVGDDGFTKAPIGAGPYRFVSLTPGVELVLEAFDGYWRKAPSVKRVVFKSVPRHMEFALPIDPHPYDPKRAKRLLVEAGYPNGFDGGDISPNPPYFTLAEAIGGNLGAVGIRVRLRTMERAAWLTAWREKKLKGVVLGAQGAGGNAATRIEGLATKGGMFAYGVLPEVEDLFQRQARELDRRKREELLHQIQKILFERVVFAPIWENGFIRGVGPRVQEGSLELIPAFPYSAPMEDVRLKP